MTSTQEIDELRELLIKAADKHFPKGEAKERGKAMVLVAELNQALSALIEERYDKVDRFEVIDDTGRAYVKGSIYGTPVKVELDLQDDGRTLKVFVRSEGEK